ncbi:MAG TPA: sulfite oxidase [Chloroflexota bacterium]|nr:sulfite oxidase [Chloroflexota bacterium]
MADSRTDLMAGSATNAVPNTDQLDILGAQPLVAETRLARQVEELTPNDRFFIRANFNIPLIDPRTWSLAVSGAVRDPQTLTLADLRQLPARSLAATMECAGNGRSYLPPPTEGNQFRYGAVSAASWTGTSLSEVLSAAGLSPEVVEIAFTGYDKGYEKKAGAELHFERSLPLAQALHPDTMLVWEMNGEPLPPEHGGPVRLLVPGWYGVASVKWVAEIRALTEPFAGYFQTKKYIIPRDDGTITPVQERRPRSLIAEPVENAVLTAGSVTLRGLAWAGNQPVEQVEVSFDGGDTWQVAQLQPVISAYAWRHWSIDWNAAPGSYVLKSRATDARGRVQPAAGEWNLLGYCNNGIQGVPVVVK